MSYLKSEPSNLSNSKILQIKAKKLQHGTKNALFGDSWATNLKRAVLFEMSTLKPV